MTWQGRTDPGNRVLPPHLKLAILSRGRISLPTANVLWLVDAAIRHGSAWPARLRKPLQEIFPELPVTVELFYKQRESLTPPEIDATVNAYLSLRRRDHMQRCLYVLYGWAPHARRAELERLLGLDLSRLYTKPNVRPTRRDADRYLLLAYVCIPRDVLAHLKDDAPTAPPAPVDLKAPLEGFTAPNVERNLRDKPSLAGAILADQDGDVVSVAVVDKSQADGIDWLLIELLEPMRVKKDGKRFDLRKGTRCWISKEGVDPIVAPWAFFRHQVREYETAHVTIALSERITRFRQSTHRKETPFDTVIGTKTGTEYLEDIPFDPQRWQLARDYQAVRAPDGRIVDIHHLAVGLDVLQRKEEASSFAAIPIGTNWAASTWSGDIGAGIADMKLRSDTNWERRMPKATVAERTEHYFSTRAPDWDLLGDVDAWQLNAIRARGELRSIDAIFASYYEDLTEGGQRPLTTSRSQALSAFLAHYGFTYEYAKDATNHPALLHQAPPMRRLIREIELFAQVWMFNRKPALVASRDEAGKKPDGATVAAMASLFSYWLEDAAIENGAEVPRSGP